MENLRVKLLIIFCLFTTVSLQAQDFMTGKMDVTGGSPVDVLYDRTQYAVNASLFKSVYKIMDSKKTVLYTVSLTHDQVKATIVIYLRPEGGTSRTFTIPYEPEKDGLIIDDLAKLDTVFSMSKSYGYLLSFTDADRDYPILHKIRMDDANELELDPLSKLRLKRHIPMVRSIMESNAAAPKEVVHDIPMAKAGINDAIKVAEEKRSRDVYQNDNFGTYLFTERDSLYARSLAFNKAVTKMVKGLQTDSISSFKGKHPGKDGLKYKGKKKKGKPDGKGILIVSDNIYEGIFKKGVFVSGKVVIRSEWYEYYGEYSKDTFPELSKNRLRRTDRTQRQYVLWPIPEWTTGKRLC
jgi:hypothetical protein